MKPTEKKQQEVQVITNKDVIEGLNIGLVQLGNYSMTDFVTNLQVCKNQVMIKDIIDAYQKTIDGLQKKFGLIDPETKDVKTKKLPGNGPGGFVNEIVFESKQKEEFFKKERDKILSTPITPKLYTIKTSILKDVKDASGNLIPANVLFLISSIIEDDAKILI